MRIGQNPDYPPDSLPEVSPVDRDIDIVDRLRMDGPNAMELADLAANEIERLRRVRDELLIYINGVAKNSAQVVAAMRATVNE